MFNDPAQAMLALVVGIGALVFTAYCWGRICAKAGFPAWWGVLMIVPVLNLVPFLYLVFGPWPVHNGSHR